MWSANSESPWDPWRLLGVVEFVINGGDYRDWSEITKAAHAYIRRRNRDHHDPRIIELENRRKVA